MAYVAGVFDRALSDVTNRTAKGFINVADWERIYGNASEVNGLVVSTLGIAITFDAVAVPTIVTIATVANLNTLLANIERLRIASCLPAITGLVEIKDDWLDGSSVESPTYLIVNSWEQVLDIIYYGIVRSSKYWISCGVSSLGQTRFHQHRWR